MTPSLAKQIKIARITLEWSREELAHKAGVCTDTIRNLETGAHRPYLRNLSAIFRVISEYGVEMPDPIECWQTFTKSVKENNHETL